MTRRSFIHSLALSITAVAAASGPKVLLASAAEDKQNSVFSVALLQMKICGTDQSAYLKKGEWFCRKAAALGADIALFPEMWNIGYTHPKSKGPDEVKKWQARAISVDSPFISHFRNLAKELKMAIAITYLQKAKGQPKNSVSLIDRNGQIPITYSKIHTCDFVQIEAATDPGDDFYVTILDTAAGKVKVGLMICYDREQPESARILMLKGAELILTPNACRLTDISIDEFKVRAYENTLGVAMTNYAQTLEDNNGDGKQDRHENGRSCAFDAKGEPVVIAGKEQGIYLAKFNLDEIRKRQKTFTLGNAWRRPYRYKLLLSNEVAEQYKRKNAFGQPFDRTKR